MLEMSYGALNSELDWCLKCHRTNARANTVAVVTPTKVQTLAKNTVLGETESTAIHATDKAYGINNSGHGKVM